jgi:hypothetical protein
MVSERASQRAFFGVSALPFTAASAEVTIVCCAPMSAMGERCGCPDRHAAWRRGVVARHVWVVVMMMVAMMLLPSFWCPNAVAL